VLFMGLLSSNQGMGNGAAHAGATPVRRL